MWLVIIIFAFSVAIPSLQRATKYTKKDIRTFDDTYDIGFFDMTFNESLYGYQAFGSSQCFTNTSYYPNNLVCGPCDWTNPLICNGTIRGTNSTCPCGKPPFLCFPNLYPFGSGIWEPNSSFTIVQIHSGTADIAYHPQPPNNRSCIIFKVDVLEGAALGILLYYGETWIGNGGLYVLSRHGTATICPSDPRWGQTNVARIISSTKFSYSKVKISVQYQDVPSTIYPSTCTSQSGSHQCLPPNVFTRLSPLSGFNHIRVVIDPPAPRCGVIGFWASSNEHLVSTDPWTSPQNSTNAFRTHREGPFDGRIWPSLYPYCLQAGEYLYAFVLSSKPVDFFIDTTKEWMILRPLTDFAPPDFYKRFLGAVSINCQNKNFTAHRTNYAISETMDTGSANLRMVFPSNNSDIFYPPPFFANDAYYLQNIPTRPMDPNRIIVSLFLNQRLSTRSQPLVWTQPWFQNAYEWLTEDEWQKCTLSIGGTIATADGTSLQFIYQNNITKDLSCDPNLYRNASQTIDEIQSEITNLISQPDIVLSDVYRLWFLQDRITASNDFYYCKQKVKTYYTTSVLPDKSIFTNQCVARFGTTEFDKDPCCLLNTTSLYDTCIFAIRNVSDQYKINQYTIDSCPSQQCAKVSLTNLLLQLNLDKDPTACSNLVDRPLDQNIYWHCVNKIWGPEPVTFAGPNCTHDIDCIDSTCNIYSGHCSVDIAAGESNLISCIYDGLTQFSRTFISDELGLNATDPNIKTFWLEKFSNIFQCSDPFTPVGFNLNWANYAGCYGCNGFVINTTTLIPTWAFSPGPSWPSFGRDCWAVGSSGCSIVTSLFRAKSYCEVQGCNNMPYENKGYFPFVSSSNYCPNNTFCGISDDGFFYNDITNTISVSNCNNSTLCILANGTRIRTVDPIACQLIFSCNVDCDGNTCNNQSACNKAGSCSDSTDYNIGIWARIYEKETSGCFFTIRYQVPFNPTTSVCEPPFRNTILGCSAYPSTFPINQSSCLSGKFQWGDSSIFELINPRWLTKAKTQPECIGYGNVCNDEDHPLPAGLATYTNTLKIGCTGPATQLFKWTSGRWLPGQARSATIVTGKLAKRFSNISRLGLNLPIILANLTKAVNKLQSLKVQSSAFCRNTYKRSLDELVCSCLTGYNESFCYTKKENTTSIGIACDEQSSIQTGDLQIKLEKTSLPPATCDTLFISTSSIVIYQSRTITPLRTLLVNYEEDTEFAIRNEQLGIYGKVLTDGYSAVFSKTIVNITICIKLSILRDNYQLDKYPILDLARRGTNSLPDDLTPLNLTIVGDSIFCAHIDKLVLNDVYYFIQRVEQNYTTVERTVFSSGEIAYISLLLALYCFGLIAAISKFTKLAYVYFTTRSEEYKPARLAIVLLLMASFFLFRVVLFSLLLNQGLLGLISTRAINYLLFEFPILLYFSFVTNYIFTWLTSITLMKKFSINHERKLRIANYASILLNGLIFIMFIIIIILFETIIFSPYFICNGAVVLFDSEQSFVLLLAYRIIFSFIEIIIGFGLLFAGLKLSSYLTDPEFNISRKVRIKLDALSVVGGFGLIGQGIYFLVITATRSTPINYVSLSILLVLEIIPALLFVFVESIGNPEERSTMSVSK